jgi:hypothetical protein
VALLAEQAQQALVVDVEPKRLGCRVKIGSIDKQRDSFGWIKMHQQVPNATSSLNNVQKLRQGGRLGNSPQYNRRLNELSL